jgi:triosephosphate isomerase
MKTIIGNWKMQVGVRESVALARGSLYALRGKKQVPEIVLCPPFVALSDVRKIVTRSHAALGAQDVFWEDTGSYTGEISPRMLSELGVRFVLVGHSERREYLGETDEMIAKKVRSVLQHGLTPILCVGETAQEHEQGMAQEVVIHQLETALAEVEVSGTSSLWIAYEPRWAIGTGKAATPQDAVMMHKEIRACVAKFLSSSLSSGLRVLYGGSVDGENAYAFLREREVDGVLVGGASVKLTQWQEVLSAAMEAMEGEAHTT